MQSSRDEAYEALELASRYYGENGSIMHTWTCKSAFNAGWRAALDAVQSEYESTIASPLKEGK